MELESQDTEESFSDQNISLPVSSSPSNLSSNLQTQSEEVYLENNDSTGVIPQKFYTDELDTNSNSNADEDEMEDTDIGGEGTNKFQLDGTGDLDVLMQGNEEVGQNRKRRQEKREGQWYLDEFSEEEEDSDEEENDEIDENEIDSLLEEGLPKSKRINKKLGNVGEKLLKTGKRADAGNQLTIKKIVVLEEKGGNSFEVLPGGWIQVRHSSGMPLYLHRKSRVCTLAKPYYLGTGSVRRHSIPLSGIPCLAYRKALEKEARDKELFESTVQELENKQEEEPVTEKSEVMDLLTKCLNANASSNKEQRSKRNTLMSSESVSMDTCKSLKRKLENSKKKGNQNKMKKFSNSIDEISSALEPVGAIAAKSCPETGNINDTTNATDMGETNACTKVEPFYPNGNEESMEVKVQATSTESQTPTPQGHHHRRGKRGKDCPGMRALLPLAKVETAKENASLYSVAPLELRDYCQPLFNFAEVECKRFKTWKARRNHTKELKRKQLERPTLPDSAQVIKFFDLSKGNDEQMVKKFTDYVFNPNGKSSVCILHEFVQHTLRKQPTYAFQELENAATPYSACVLINGTPYGRGYGSSKKTAKAEAAKATLEVLIPQMKGQLNGTKADSNGDFDITEYFQQVEMNDIRIPKMCTSVSEPSPYTLLLTCLQRNFGLMGSSNIKFEMLPTDLSKGNPTNHFKMSADQYSVTVTASNKREGKQLGSQLLLSKIHPHITNFGSFIKMYGNGSIKSVKEKKQEEQQITTLQSKASANSPNWAILNKLRLEMLKLSEEEKAGGDRIEGECEMPPLENESTSVSSSSIGNDAEADNKPVQLEAALPQPDEKIGEPQPMLTDTSGAPDDEDGDIDTSASTVEDCA